MNLETPRLRMFAGPNGSGKTTVKNGLQRDPEWFGVYINPDDIEAEIRTSGFLSLSKFEITTSSDELQQWFANSSLLEMAGIASAATQIEYKNETLRFSSKTINSYLASVLSDLLRKKLLLAGRSFSFETVMSHHDKVDLLRDAQRLGFRTYLYYVATEDPQINVERVKNRVNLGGHNVPQEKILSRYYKSLRLLPQAIRHSSRAFLFDTSELAPWYFAEATDGTKIHLKSEEMPHWFRMAWEQF